MGWKLNNPKLNQPVAPLVLSPKNNTAINKTKEKIYKNKINEEVLNIRQSKKEKMRNAQILIPKKISCFFREKKEGVSWEEILQRTNKPKVIKIKSEKNKRESVLNIISLT